MNEKIDDFENIEDIFPLSDIQVGMIYESLVPGTASVYYNQSIIPITDKNFDFERLKWAVSLLVEKHPMLRTGFNFEDSEEPVQVVYKKIELDIEYYNLCRQEPVAQEDYIKSCLRREREKFFDISAAKPLWRIRIFQTAENKIYFAWLNHHAIHDGWSFASFMTELNNTYLRLQTDPHFVPGQLKSTYKDFIIDQVIEKKNITTIEFWKNELADYKRFEIPGGVGGPATGKSKKISIVEKLGNQAFENLNGIVKKYNISLRHICFAAYVYTLYMVSYENEFVVGIVTHNRPECEDGDKIIGCFLNEVPVKISIPAQLKWLDFIFMIDRKLIQLAGYNKLSLFEIARITGENIPGKNPFFDTIFNYTDFHIFNRMDRSLISEIDENTSPLSDNTQIETNTPLDFSVDISGQPLLTVSFFDTMLTTGMGRKLCHYFINIINRFGTETEHLASKEAIMSNEEKEKILYQFNNSETDFPLDKTIPQLFAEQVKQTPGAVALTAADPRTCSILSYAQLNKNSGCLASRLKEQGVIPDDIVGIMVERSTGMIIGILGILIAGGAYLPIEPTLPKERIDYMLKESAAKMLLTASEIEYFSKGSVFNSHHSSLITHHLNPSNLAYVIYTSGSTGKPKGVLNMHANIVRIAKNTDCLTITPADRILQMSNYAFDGSVFDIFGALLNGAVLVLTTKETPASVELLAGIIKREQVTVFLVTTALFNILIDLEKASCKNVRKILFGGERVSVEHTRKALAYLGKEKIIHAYGPTESTVYASYYPINEIAVDATSIPIGKPLSNTVIYINDKNKHLTPIGVKGEIYIGGQGIARGYLNNPELTGNRFNRSYGSYKTYIRYKTGDLARWLPDGNIEFLERDDQQIKIRGFRVELGEIENRLLNYQGIKEAVVLALEADGDKFLCAYIGSARENDENGLREFLAVELPEYMIPSSFVWLKKLPLNSNGKVDRKALPRPGFKVSRTYKPPRNAVEKKLVKLWAEILGSSEAYISQLEKTIGIDENFFQLGGHSLKATILASRIHKELNVKLPLGEFFKNPTIRDLSKYIYGAEEKNYKSIKPAEKKEYYALSSAQKRLFILQQMDLTSTAYNMPNVLLLPENFLFSKLTDTFKALIKRHESLRTSFHMIADQPVQKIHENVEFKIENLAATEGTEGTEKAIHSFLRAFDLAEAPLLRMGFVKKEGKYFLLVDMHHIISDGISYQILVKDFLAIYKEEKLLPLTVQYKDFAEWQHSETGKENRKQQENFWLKAYEGEIPVLNLPADFSRSTVQSFAGDIIEFDISREETRLLKEMARSQDATLFMVLLAIFNIYLAKLSNQEIIIVGTPTAGRRHADLEQVIGMFVNTLALCNYPSGEKIFQNFLSEVKEKTLPAFENQDYPFEDLVEKVVKDRDQARNPLFDVMFALQNFSKEAGEIQENESAALRFKDFFPGEETAKFDLSLDAIERGERLCFICSYCTKLFCSETILRFIQYFKKIISSVIKNPRKRIFELEIIPDDEKHHLLFDLNNTARAFPRDKAIQQLFEEQVLKSPDRISIFGHGQTRTEKQEEEKRRREEEKNGGVETLRAASLQIQITYRQLNVQSDHLAGLLIAKGVLPGTIVGIMMERSIDQITGLLGILKSGGAYMSIDPDYPGERVNYMLRDSAAKMLLKASEIEYFSKECLSNSHHSSFITRHSNLTYIIYTSGSTGLPRGVMIEHRHVVRLVKNTDYIEILPRDRLLPTGSPAFDITTFEIWGPLCNGAMLSLVDKVLILNAGKLKKVLVNHNITLLHLIPQLFNQLAALDLELFAGLRCFLVGGDVVNPAYIKELRKRCPHLKILHMYGPTENTTFSTFFPVRQDYEFTIPIGTPIANSTAYIVDKYGYLQPIGVIGELCVGGEGVAGGYLNNPELTHKKFRPLMPQITQMSQMKNKNSALRADLNAYGDKENFQHSNLYCTGDLARWLPEGNIEFLGRIDQQIKIRGFRVELGEIENRLMSYPGIKETTVSVCEEKEDKYLCAYFVSDRDYEEAGLRKYLHRKLPGYMIPSYFVRLEKIPLTTNGKINRKALPKPGMNRREIFTAPRNELEKKLIDLWAEILGKDESIGIDDNFFQLGGHSLKATVLVSRIQKELDVITPLSEIFKAPTVRTLTEYIKETKSNVSKDMDQNLVLLKKGLKENNHLFFIHDGRGEIEAYLELCKHLTVDFNYWGIRIDSAENVTIQELAQIHIKTLKKIQAHGPYHLAGWSLGGTIAFEIALQLEQSGEKIAFLALIDTPPPHKNLIKEIEFNDQSMDYSNLSKQLLVARALYKPRAKMHTLVHYIAASQSKIFKKENWQKYCFTKITYVEIPGDHFSILKKKQVLQLAGLFSKFINQIISK